MSHTPKIPGVNNGVVTIQTNVSTLQTDVSTLETDISTIQTHVSSLQSDLQSLKINNFLSTENSNNLITEDGNFIIL